LPNERPTARKGRKKRPSAEEKATDKSTAPAKGVPRRHQVSEPEEISGSRGLRCRPSHQCDRSRARTKSTAITARLIGSG